MIIHKCKANLSGTCWGVLLLADHVGMFLVKRARPSLAGHLMKNAAEANVAHVDRASK